MPSLPKAADSGCKFGGPRRHPHFRPAGYKFGLGIPKDFLEFNNSLEGLAEIIESIVTKQPKEERRRGRFRLPQGCVIFLEHPA